MEHETDTKDPLRTGAERANASYMQQRRVVIDPITRLEGHGKIDIFLNDAGGVDRAFFQVPELRGFEQFVVGRPVEDMPQITSRICGVCPTAHHMVATKALDALYDVEPTLTGRLIRELVYAAFMAEDHALHFYFLGGPDFVMGPDAPAASRNVLGVISKVGREVGLKVIEMRRRLREITALAGGKVIHPVLGLPGGVSRRIKPDEVEQIRQVADDAVEFAQFSLQLFRDVVLANSGYVDMITSDAYSHQTYYMGLVDGDNKVNFYDGAVRVVAPTGGEWDRFTGEEYLDHVAEHVEPWSYTKFTYLKQLGWKGFVDGADSGVYSVAPLARLNVADGMATPEAQEAYEEYTKTLGMPVHATLANHWARLVELLYAAERLQELANHPELTGDDYRRIPTATPTEGIGVIEAPRGTLFHHYQTDERGIVQKANLIVATQNNSARIAMSVEKAAKGAISGGQVDEAILNKIEMAFRAYDPCHACATHTLPGSMPLILSVHDTAGSPMLEIRRDADGGVHRSG
jgi:F420-non-reducing hydrogenase large subunit